MSESKEYVSLQRLHIVHAVIATYHSLNATTEYYHIGGILDRKGPTYIN
jgi:hypothetical protein